MRLKNIILVNLLYSLLTHEQVKSGYVQEVLVFGGNGMMGVPTVERLLHAGYSVTVANRGNWYWDSAYVVKPRVRYIFCDRNNPLSEGVLNYFRTTNPYAIIDFSAYHAYAVAEVAEALRRFKHEVNIYVYISSDSVYEVCVKSEETMSKENDAVRPADANLRDEYAGMDNYGHRKLQCEEFLFTSKLPYVNLRLPDVIGPRDNTYRWWMNQLWLQLPSDIYRKIYISQSSKSRQLSFIYSEDVATAITTALNQPSKFVHQSINLAWQEGLTITELLDEIAKNLRLEHFYYEQTPSTGPYYQYPSVTRGPIDTNKAEHLGLTKNFTSWKEAVKDTVKFYQDALTDRRFQFHLSTVVSQLAAIVSDGDTQQLQQTVHWLSEKKRHDEL